MKTCKLTLLLLALCAALLFTLCGCDDKKDPAPTNNTPSTTQGDTNNQGSEQGGEQGGDQGGTGEQPSTPATEGLKYELNEDGNSYSVTGIGTATDTDIVIAATYEGKPVTGIGERAFYTYHSLTSITIPSTVTSVGYEAFRGCETLASVTFGENSQLTSISGDMFRGCKSLASITIPSTVTSIGGYAFDGCTNLASVTFENTEGWWVSESYGATSGKSVPATTVGDPRLAALRLSDTSYEYYAYDWHRS